MSDLPQERTTHDPAHDARDFGAEFLTGTLRGDMPTIHTVGILAATNPGGQLLAASENRARAKTLREDLVGYGKRQIRGIHEGMEHPFLVANLERARLLDLGAKYGQTHLIFGQRAGKGESLGMRFQLLGAPSRKDGAYSVLAERKLFAQLQEPASAAERRFLVPGFEHDDPAAEFRGARVFTYRRENLPHSPETRAVLARFLASGQELCATLIPLDVNPFDHGTLFVQPTWGVKYRPDKVAQVAWQLAATPILWQQRLVVATPPHPSAVSLPSSI